MPQHNRDPLSLGGTGPQAFLYQLRADPLPLKLRQHRRRRQGDGVDRALLGMDRQAAEEDVANDLASCFGNQRNNDITAVAQSIDQDGFGGLAEGQVVDLVDGGSIGGSFRTDSQSSSSSSGSP